MQSVYLGRVVSLVVSFCVNAASHTNSACFHDDSPPIIACGPDRPVGTGDGTDPRSGGVARSRCLAVVLLHPEV